MTDKEGMQVPVILNKVVEYEMGWMNEEETIELFQELMDRGVIEHLQGHYGRTAQALLDAGLIQYPNRA